MKKSEKGFTLIEVIFALSILSTVTLILFGTASIFIENTNIIKAKSRTLGGVAVLNSTLSSMISSSYGIKYSGSDNSSSTEDYLTLYTDKLESSEIELYLKENVDKGTKRLFMKKNGKEIPLHSSTLYVKEFNLTYPTGTDLSNGEQPYIIYEILATSRGINVHTGDSEFQEKFKKGETYITGTATIRNYVPSSGKNNF